MNLINCPQIIMLASILIVGCLFAILYLSYLYWEVFRLLFRSEQHTSLSFPTRRLDLGSITIVIVVFALRSVIGTLRSLGRPRNGKSPVSTTLTMPLQIEDEDIRLYLSATKADKVEKAAHWALFLSALSEPAMLLLLGKPLSAIQPLGAVNVRNRFELLRPDMCRLAVLKEINDLRVIASLDPKSTAVKRGLEFDLEVRIESKTGGTIFRQVFTILQFTRHNEVPTKPPHGLDATEQPQHYFPVKLSHSSPSEWAALCKDYNPIHISSLAAKAFGFPGKIAHGNHVAALAISAIPSDLEVVLSNERPIWFEVSFRRPVVVPAELEVSIPKPSPSEFRFSLARESKLCITGTLGHL